MTRIFTKGFSASRFLIQGPRGRCGRPQPAKLHRAARQSRRGPKRSKSRSNGLRSGPFQPAFTRSKGATLLPLSGRAACSYRKTWPCGDSSSWGTQIRKQYELHRMLGKPTDREHPITGARTVVGNAQNKVAPCITQKQARERYMVRDEKLWALRTTKVDLDTEVLLLFLQS